MRLLLPRYLSATHACDTRAACIHLMVPYLSRPPRWPGLCMCSVTEMRRFFGAGAGGKEKRERKKEGEKKGGCLDLNALASTEISQCDTCMRHPCSLHTPYGTLSKPHTALAWPSRVLSYRDEAIFRCLYGRRREKREKEGGREEGRLSEITYRKRVPWVPY